MPSSPRSPRHLRPTSEGAVNTGRPTSNNSPHSRKISYAFDQVSVPTRAQVADHDADIIPTTDQDVEPAHGSLADELAEALDEEDEVNIALEVTSKGNEVSSSPPVSSQGSVQEGVKHSSFNAERTPSGLSASDSVSSDAECEKFFADSDVASLDVRDKILQALVKDFENLIQDGGEGSFVKLAQSLRDLPTQSAIENGASRLMTSHVALTSHVTNSARSLQNLVYPLFSPFAGPFEQDDIDELLPYITALLTAVPTQEVDCLAALSALRSLTDDLGHTLNILSDSIYMVRQNLSSAGRKLRVVADMVYEMKQEADTRQNAITWIESGHWESRLLDRQCRTVCGDVIGGFEEVCQGLRQRLLADSDYVR